MKRISKVEIFGDKLYINGELYRGDAKEMMHKVRLMCEKINNDLITDSDDLRQGIEIIYDCENRTIELFDNSENPQSNIKDKVMLQAVYALSLEEWRLDDELIKQRFPFISITEMSFELMNHWTFKNKKTEDLLIGEFVIVEPDISLAQSKEIDRDRRKKWKLEFEKQKIKDYNKFSSKLKRFWKNIKND